MKRIGIRNKSTGEFVYFYLEGSQKIEDWGGSGWGDARLFEHVEAPESLVEIKAARKAELDAASRQLVKAKREETEYQSSLENTTSKAGASKISSATSEAEVEMEFKLAMENLK